MSVGKVFNLRWVRPGFEYKELRGNDRLVSTTVFPKTRDAKEKKKVVYGLYVCLFYFSLDIVLI